MTPLKAGTRFTDDRKNLAYSVEQTATLADINDERYALNIAQAKYKNHVLLPDGTISADLSVAHQAISSAAALAQKTVDDVRNKLTKATTTARRATAANRKDARQEVTALLAESNRANAAATAAEALALELDDHIEQERFLFVLSDHGLPVIYYQCAVAGNPDLPKLAGADKPDKAVRAAKKRR